MLMCIEYGILFVDTVDMTIKACNALNAMFVQTVNTQGVVLLVSLLHSHKEDWFRHDRLSILNVICMSTLSI